MRAEVAFAICAFQFYVESAAQSSFQGMYLDLGFTGGELSSGVSSSCVSAGNGDAVAFAAVGMMRERKALCADSTPK